MSLEQLIPLSAPPVADLPCWGTRADFPEFFVELVPRGQRIFNVRLERSFASISFAPAEGTSSLAGDRLRRYERRPFEYIVVPPRFPLRGSAEEAPEVLAFVFDFDRIAESLSRFASAPSSLNPAVILGNPSAFTTSIAKKIRTHMLVDDVCRDYLHALGRIMLTEMCAPLIRPTRSKRRSPLRGNKISMLLKYIDANLDGDLATDTLAGLVDASPDQLARGFKKAVGDSPHNYVLQRRIDGAIELLKDNELSLSQVAYSTGFSSQSHMTTSFKKALGTTPGAVRRNT